MEPYEIAAKLDRRDGAKVVAYREIGLPVFRMNCMLTLQEHSALGAIEEFLLRCMAQGLTSSQELGEFLGLPIRVITTQIAQSILDGAIVQSEQNPPRYKLTPVGRSKLEEIGNSSINKEQIPIYVDGITRRVVPIESRDLWTNAQLSLQGVAPVPPTPRRAPRISEVDIADINQMFELMAGSERPDKRAIRVDSVIGRVAVNFRRAVAVCFKSDDGRKVSMGFAIDGRESQEHEVEFARSRDAEHSLVFGSMFDADRRRVDIRVVARELRRDVPDVYETVGDVGRRTTLRIAKNRDESSVLGDGVRVLSVYDHPPLLREAFERAAERIIIVSPWIRAEVVNQEFVASLARCLQRGVQVTIAYGIGRRDRNERPADVTAREALSALTRSFANFKLVRKGDTHAKVLLVDRKFFVTTSFNWLSFRGDPQQPMREEEGTMVEVPDLVDRYYEKLSARIADAERNSGMKV